MEDKELKRIEREAKIILGIISGVLVAFAVFIIFSVKYKIRYV